MTTPRVTEMPLRLEPVRPDPFIEGLRPRLAEREERERRVELVRRLMRIQAGARPARDGARNGWAARRTQRA